MEVEGEIEVGGEVEVVGVEVVGVEVVGVEVVGVEVVEVEAEEGVEAEVGVEEGVEGVEEGVDDGVEGVEGVEEGVAEVGAEVVLVGCVGVEVGTDKGEIAELLEGKLFGVDVGVDGDKLGADVELDEGSVTEVIGVLVRDIEDREIEGPEIGLLAATHASMNAIKNERESTQLCRCHYNGLSWIKM
jgi:hypothetical protein